MATCARLVPALLILHLSSTPALPQTQIDEGAAAPRGSQPGPIVFRAGIDLVALNIVVTDPQQKFVPNLGEHDFSVYEDGVQQDVSYFATSLVPLDLAILLDTSASMRDAMDLVQRAAAGFVRTLREGDRGSVIAFDSTVRVLQSFTGDTGALEQALRESSARGGTSLHNALYVALKDLRRMAQGSTDIRRQAIVVLSDGADTSSLVSFEEVVDLARRSGVSIYTILLKSPTETAIRARHGMRYFSQADFAMKTLAQETGARPFFPARVDDLDGVYGEIASELAHQYALGYYSKNPLRDGAFRRVVVRVVNRPGARPRTRTGYIAASHTTALVR